MIGAIPGFAPSVPLVAASDASMHEARRLAGFGWLTTDGDWGTGRWQHPAWMSRQTIQVAELRAVASLLVHVTPDILLTDSRAVTWYVGRWQEGYDDTPRGYDGHPGSVLARAAAAAREAPGMRVEHVRAHRGHLLNEAADSLAAIARSGDPADRKRERASGLVASFLVSWQQETRPAS
jgi:ribonuclease HI